MNCHCLLRLAQSFFPELLRCVAVALNFLPTANDSTGTARNKTRLVFLACNPMPSALSVPYNRENLCKLFKIVGLTRRSRFPNFSIPDP